jgi:hypothetical protein
VLDLQSIDLASLCEALEDHSDETSWWFDATTGTVEPQWSDDEDGLGDPEARGLLWVEAIPSSEAYRDLEDFVASVRDPRPRGLLERAIAGRGAFRRFKDTLFEFPELRAAWFAFHDRRMERRAIEWLVDAGVIDPGEGGRALTDRDDLDVPALSGPFDVDAIVTALAADLRSLYGERLRGVLLFGSWARGDATDESDIDVLVVLDEVASVWEELRRMEPVLWRQSFDNDTVISAIPIAERALDAPQSPALERARIEGRRVA